MFGANRRYSFVLYDDIIHLLYVVSIKNKHIVEHRLRSLMTYSTKSTPRVQLVLE